MSTEPLDEFLPRYRTDDNEWWWQEAGDHLNLFDGAVARMEAAETAAARARDLHSPSEFGTCNGCTADGIGNPIPHDECPTLAALDGTDGGGTS